MHRRATRYDLYRRDSAVAQAFMALSFVSAGLLLSVQVAHQDYSASDDMDSASGNVDSMPMQAASSSWSSQNSAIRLPSSIQHFVARQQRSQGESSQSVSLPSQGTDRQAGNSRSGDGYVDQGVMPTAHSQLSIQPKGVAQKQEDIRIVVDLSDRQLTLYEQNLAVHSYPIAVGKAGWETPVGAFAVTNKDPSPTWRHPLTGELVSAGESSPLGTRWIGFWADGIHQIGFHGTNQTELIGQAISHGCIRLRNSDIETLYTKVTVGTRLFIQP